ncbi:MAG: hotdog fold thioesterase [Kineosporiaceae bacterium]
MTDTTDTSGPGVADLFSPTRLAGTLLERMGMELQEVGASRAVARMPVAGNTQPFGLLHGGASAALAETVASVAATVHAQQYGCYAVGVDLNATHHRGVTTGWVHATATALSLGRTVASYDVEVRDDDGRRVCTARLTCVLRRA